MCGCATDQFRAGFCARTAGPFLCLPKERDERKGTRRRRRPFGSVPCVARSSRGLLDGAPAPRARLAVPGSPLRAFAARRCATRRRRRERVAAQSPVGVFSVQTLHASSSRLKSLLLVAAIPEIATKVAPACGSGLSRDCFAGISWPVQLAFSARYARWDEGAPLPLELAERRGQRRRSPQGACMDAGPRP